MKHLSNQQLQQIIDRGQWYLTDKEELLRIESARDFTDPHPLTDAVIEAAEFLPAPITTAQIIEHLYKSTDPTKENHKHLDKSTRQNHNIISDILRGAGFVYARRRLHDHSDDRVRGWWPS